MQQRRNLIISRKLMTTTLFDALTGRRNNIPKHHYLSSRRFRDFTFNHDIGSQKIHQK